MQPVTAPEISGSRYLSPPQYAAQLGVKADKVVAWIKAGELRAVNLAIKPGGRPRWKIPPDATVIFENSRSVQPHVAPRRRRRQSMDVTEYF